MAANYLFAVSYQFKFVNNYFTFKDFKRFFYIPFTSYQIASTKYKIFFFPILLVKNFFQELIKLFYYFIFLFFLPLTDNKLYKLSIITRKCNYKHFLVIIYELKLIIIEIKIIKKNVTENAIDKK